MYIMPYVQNDKNYKPEILQTYTKFHIAHQYDPVFKVWKFKGYICTKCGRTVQNPNIVLKHSKNCKKGPPTVYLQEPDPSQIRTVTGEEWKPLDFNQFRPLPTIEKD